MRKFLLLSLMIMAFAANAQQKLPFQGKLVQDGDPVNGSRNLQFTIDLLNWSETHDDVMVIDGFYSVILGSITPLPGTLFAGRNEVSLNISVNGMALSPITLYAPLLGNLTDNQQDITVYSPEGDIKAQMGYFQPNDAGGVVLYGNNDTNNIIIGSRDDGSRGLMEVYDASGQVAVKINADGDDNGEIVLQSNGERKVILDVFKPNDAGAMVLLGNNEELNVVNGSLDKGYRGFVGVYDSLGKKSAEILSNGSDAGEINLYSDGQKKVLIDVFQRDDAGAMLLYGNNNQENVIVGSADGGNSGFIGVYDSLGKEGASLRSLNDGRGRLEIKNTDQDQSVLAYSSSVNSGTILTYGPNEKTNLVLAATNAGYGGFIGVDDSLGFRGAELFTGNDGSGSFNLYNANHTTSVAISANSDENGEVYLYNSAGDPKVILDVFNANNAGGMVMIGDNGQQNVIVGSRNTGSQGFLGVYQTNGNQAVTIEANNANNGELNVYNKQGERKVLLDVFDQNDAGGLSVFGDNGTNNVIVGSRNTGSQGFIGVYDDNDNQAIRLIASNDNDGQVYLSKNNTTTVGIVGNYNLSGGGGVFLKDAGNNETIILDGATGVVTAIDITQTSDRRLKKNITPQENALEKVKQLQGVNYQWKNDEKGKNNIGFIAQEVEKVYPEMVNTKANGYKSVNYAVLVSALVESIKALDEKITSLEKENTRLKAEADHVNALKAEVDQIKALLMQSISKEGNFTNK